MSDQKSLELDVITAGHAGSVPLSPRKQSAIASALYLEEKPNAGAFSHLHLTSYTTSREVRVYDSRLGYIYCKYVHVLSCLQLNSSCLNHLCCFIFLDLIFSCGIGILFGPGGSKHFIVSFLCTL